MADQSLDLTLGAAGVTVIERRPSELRAIQEAQNSPKESAKDLLRRGQGPLTCLPLELVGAIVSTSRTGRLILQRDSVCKEAYFVDGHPVFVASNDPQELFGQFLVNRGLLTPEQLKRAIATMPHFGGRLGQALVGLKLLKPVDAVHLLAEQVSEKLLRTCCWERGTFEWEPGVRNSKKIVPLHLSGHRIIARAVQLLQPSFWETWMARVGTDTPDITSLIPFDSFGFGPALSAKLGNLDGTRTIRSMCDGASEKNARTISAAMFAVLVCQ